MKWNKQSISLLILIMSSIFIFSFVQIGSSSYAVFLNKATFSEGTKITSINLEGITEEEALNTLKSKITNWHEETTIKLQMDHEIFLDLGYFSFHPDRTIQKVKNAEKATIDVSINDDELLSLLKREFNANQIKAIDYKQLSQDLKTIAGNLESGGYVLDIANYIQSEKLDKTIISEVTPLIDAKYDFGQGEYTITIEGNSIFSLQDFLSDHQTDLDDEVGSRLATALYQAILPSPLEVIERHISRELPDYAELGTEAAFIKNKWDLKFYNSQDKPLELSIIRDGNQLTILLKGVQVDQYELVMIDKKSFPTRTIVQYDPSLSPKESFVTDKGKVGQSISVIKRVLSKGQVNNETLISEDYYPPVFKISKQGLTSTITETSKEESQEKSLAETKEDSEASPSELSGLETNDKSIPDTNKTAEAKKTKNQENELWEIPKVIK